MKKLRRMKVDQYTLDGVYVKTFNSQLEASKSVYGSQANISACVRGRQKQAYGYVWKCGETYRSES